MNLNDQTIMISGAAGAIGSHLVKELSKEAKKVIALDIKDGDSVKENPFRHKIESYTCDLTQFASVETTVGPILENNHVSVLINLAGLIHSEPLINLLNKDNSRHATESWDRTIKANLYSTFYLSSFVAEAMVKRRTRGLILNTSSIAAHGNSGQTAYSAAKAGIESMTKVWSKELGVFKIRCACIAPGFFNTSSTHQSLNETTVDKWKKMTPLGRLGDLNEFSDAVRFIIQNDYYTGAVLHLDGGLNI